MIAPYWRQRPWFPELLDLVVDGPVPLPLSRDLLRQPHFHRHHVGVSGLSLHAWRLSSDSLGCRVSPRMERSRLLLRAVHLLALVTKRNGLFIDSGVVLKDIRSLALLFPRWPTFCFGGVSPENSVSAVLGYHLMLSVVFHFQLPEISSSPVIQDLLTSFSSLSCGSSSIMGLGGCFTISTLSYLRISVILFPARPYSEDTLFSFLGYGQTGGGDPSSVTYGLFFFHWRWYFVCS